MLIDNKLNFSQVGSAMAQELVDAFESIGGQIPLGLECLIFHGRDNNGGSETRRAVYRDLYKAVSHAYGSGSYIFPDVVKEAIRETYDGDPA